MELRHLRYFVALAEELNFRRAAERLHVSAPALSVQIKALEELLEIQLCKRDTTMVRLTAAGEVLLHEARALLQQVRKLEETTREAAHGICGCLRIGNPGHFGYSFMSEALNTYHERFPKVNVSLVELDVELEQMAALEDGSIQIGFVYGPQLPLMKAIGHMLVIDTAMHAVMGRDHPLASLKQVPLCRMAGYPLLSVMRYDSHINNMLALFREKNLEPKAIKKVAGFNAYLAMLAAGGGVSMLPEMSFLSQAKGVVMRPIKDDMSGLRLQVHAVWKSDETSQQMRNFIEVLREHGVQHC
jgi:DNA-binding transcriptional LysR family regulator